ncbi:MAG: putative Ig domain-containing protein [Gammaproteobacteria bacterium]
MIQRSNRGVLSFVSRSCTIGLVVATFGLASCGGGDNDNDSGSASSPSVPVGSGTAVATGNRAPSIQGVPPRSLASGVSYSFTPTASDPDSQPLTFSIVNMPHWAAFSPSTGSLRGTPGPGDVGKYPNVTISVSDGTASVSLAPFGVEVVSVATGSITVNWYAPTERVDGSLLDTLSGYKIYWGTSPGDYASSAKIDHGGIATYVIEQLTPGTYYLVATAFDAAGLESGFSNVIAQAVR